MRRNPKSPSSLAVTALALSGGSMLRESFQRYTADVCKTEEQRVHTHKTLQKRGYIKATTHYRLTDKGMKLAEQIAALATKA